MKVVFVNRFFHPDESATSQMLTDLATGLAAAGLDVHVICSRQRYDDATANLRRLEVIRGVSVRRISGTRFGRDRLAGRAVDYASFYLACAFRLLRDLKPGDTVVAKTDPPLLSIVAMMAAWVRGATLVNWLQDVFPEVATLLGANPLPRPLDALLRGTRNRSLRAARLNVVLGERMQERLLDLGVPATQIKIIENWADHPSDTPKSVAMSSLRAELGLQRKFVVGYSGNLGRAHEFQTVLDASERLRSDPDIVFLMIGGGAGMARLKLAVAERGLDNFRFLPHRRREVLADSLAAADVHWVSLVRELEGFIVPSKFYGILAARRAVIFVGDTDGELARAIRTAQCGFAVAPGDVAGFVGALMDLKSDPFRRARLAGNGFQAHSNRYSASSALQRWKAILDAQAQPVDA